MSVQAALLRAGVPAAIAKAEAPRAEAAMIAADITTQRRASYFLAQVLHESAGLRYFEEIVDGSAYEGRKDLGNTKPGDGRRYKGRGPIQLTGRSNYRAAGQALGLPLESDPTLAARHDVGWRIAAWYWQTRGLNGLADAGQFMTVTRRINGGTNGYPDRRRYLRLVSTVDCRPVDKWAGYTRTERRWIREYDQLLHDDRNLDRRRALRRAMRAQRKRVWAAAQQSGWNRANRRARYRSLLARSR